MSAFSDPATILVVDDAPANVRVLADLLHPPYVVKTANTGERCLAIAAADPPPDLILLDVMMPRLSGYEVLERLREDPRTRDIPVIFVTAMDGTADEERGLDVGAVDYITKPIRPTIVLARVRTQLELKRARDLLRDQNARLEAEVARQRRSDPLRMEVQMPVVNGLDATAAIPELRAAECDPVGSAICGLPGIDAAMGLKFARGKLSVYLELLRMFADPTHVGEGGLTRSAEAGDLPELRQRAHALKGVASLVGATTVQSLAIEVEAAIRAGALSNEVTHAAARVDEAFAGLAAAIRKLPRLAPERETPQP